MQFKTDEAYSRFLERMNFNPEQISFIIKQRGLFLSLRKNEDFYYDTYERDMWYTMNRSGLFEKTKENKSDIFEWKVFETRMFITEL